MDSKRTNMSLIKALSYFNLRELPEVDNGKDYWIGALARVRKADGGEYYVYMEKDNNLKNIIKKDFGSVSAIKEIISIHPFDFLKNKYVKQFTGQKKEDRIKYLRSIYGGGDAFSDMTLKELNKEVLKTAIMLQRQKESI